MSAGPAQPDRQSKDSPIDVTVDEPCKTCGFVHKATKHEAAALDLYMAHIASMLVDDTEDVSLFAPSGGIVGLVSVTVNRRSNIRQFQYKAQAGRSKLPKEWFEEGDFVIVERLT